MEVEQLYDLVISIKLTTYLYPNTMQTCFELIHGDAKRNASNGKVWSIRDSETIRKIRKVLSLEGNLTRLGA